MVLLKSKARAWKVRGGRWHLKRKVEVTLSITPENILHPIIPAHCSRTMGGSVGAVRVWEVFAGAGWWWQCSLHDHTHCKGQNHFFILNKVFCMALWEAPSPLCRPSCTSELHSWHTSSFVAEGVGYITPTASTILWAYEVHLYSSDSSGGFCYLALVVKSSGTLSHLQNG